MGILVYNLSRSGSEDKTKALPTAAITAPTAVAANVETRRGHLGNASVPAVFSGVRGAFGPFTLEVWGGAVCQVDLERVRQDPFRVQTTGFR